MPFEWKQGFDLPYGLLSSEDWGTDLISRPLLYKVKQMYVYEYTLVEGAGIIKFALSQDGKLWMWDYGSGGLAGDILPVFPNHWVCSQLVVLIDHFVD